MILFEFPLTEQVRTWLRLEASGQRWRHHLGSDSPHDHHAALLTFFELIAIANRTDLKRDLVAILTAPSPPLPSASSELSDETLAAQLHAQSGRLVHALNDDPFLHTIKTRAHLAGGLSPFDLPAYYRWLQKPPSQRRRDLEEWFSPVQPLLTAVDRALERLRTGGKLQDAVAERGIFQLPLGGQLPRLVRVWLDLYPPVIPKIAANKYQLNLHFLIADCGRELPYLSPLPFRLALCA
ncbi:MAG: cell division protein ZapD [Hydrogenophilus sp.]|nr:cell division protein ZapD [Hydrogenophilus sp.]